VIERLGNFLRGLNVLVVVSNDMLVIELQALLVGTV